MLVKSSKIKVFLTVFLAVSISCLFIGIGGVSAAEKKPITIGSDLPLTGPYASDGEEMTRALTMGIEEINAQGGVLGRPLKLITGDVGGLEAEKISAVGEMLIGRGVDAVITGYADGGVDTQVLGEYDVPYLHGDAMLLSTKPVMEHPEKYWNVFQFYHNDIDYGPDALHLFTIPEKMGYKPPNKEVAIIVADYDYNIEPADEFERRAKAQGYKIVIKEITTLGGNLEWGPTLSKIAKKKPAFVTFWNLDPADAARFMIQWKNKFMANPMDTLLFMQYTPNVPEFLELAEDAADGLIWTVAMKPRGAEFENYKKRWKKRFGEPLHSVYATATREALEIWREAVERVGDVNDYWEICKNIKEHPYRCKYSEDIIVFDPHYQCAIAGEGLLAIVWHQIWGKKSYEIYPNRFKEIDWKLPPWMKSK